MYAASIWRVLSLLWKCVLSGHQSFLLMHWCPYSHQLANTRRPSVSAHLCWANLHNWRLTQNKLVVEDALVGHEGRSCVCCTDIGGGGVFAANLTFHKHKQLRHNCQLTAISDGFMSMNMDHFCVQKEPNTVTNWPWLLKFCSWVWFL